MKLDYDLRDVLLLCESDHIAAAVIANFTSNYHCYNHAWIKLNDYIVRADEYPPPRCHSTWVSSTSLREYESLRYGTDKIRWRSLAIMIDVFSSRVLL